MSQRLNDVGVREAVGGSAGPWESEKERLNRKLIELLNELRIAIPGVQVLFAFLLILPFSQPSIRTHGPQQVLYAIALVSASLSSVLLIAPSAYHRLRFRRLQRETLEDKREMIAASDRLAVGGLLCLSVAMCAAILLVLAMLIDWVVAAAVTAAVAGTFAWLWYLLPLSRRRRDPRRHEPLDA